MDLGKSEEVTQKNELGPWPFKTDFSFGPCIFLHEFNQIGQRWTTDDKWTEFGSNVPSPTSCSAFIVEFVAMEALRGVFRGVFRGVCNRLLFCWAFLRETAEHGDEKQRKPGHMWETCGFFRNQAKVYSTWMNQKHVSSWRRKQHGNDSKCYAIYYIQVVIICLYTTNIYIYICIDW